MIPPARVGRVLVDPPVVLAPLAGYSGLPMRLLSRRAGAGLVCSEMVSARALHHRDRRTQGMLQACPEERPLSLQLFGCQPEEMAEAAQAAVAAGAQIVDINLGCTVPKVARTGSGAALMRRPELAAEIVRAMVAAVPVPVTVKMRAGLFPGDDSYLALAQSLVEAGAAAIALHARTVSQRFTGGASLAAIAKLVRELPVPVIGNGDINTPEAARRMLEETGCAAVMIGRAALGNPWIFAQVAAMLRGEEWREPTVEERVAVALCHAQMQAVLSGEARAVRELRPALARYAQGLPGAAAVRARIMKTHTLGEVREAMEGLVRKEGDWVGLGRG